MGGRVWSPDAYEWDIVNEWDVIRNDADEMMVSMKFTTVADILGKIEGRWPAVAAFM